MFVVSQTYKFENAKAQKILALESKALTFSNVALESKTLNFTARVNHPWGYLLA